MKNSEIKVPKDFNWKSYLSLNPSLKKAGLKNERQASYHYFHYGQKQNRKYKNDQIKIQPMSVEELNKVPDSPKKFLIATVAWKRPEVLKIFLDVNSKYCDILCVRSPEDSLLSGFTDSDNTFFIDCPNNPLGRKLNKRIDWFLEHKEYTHIIFLGSDNIISKEIFDSIKTYSKKYDLISWSDIYFFDLISSETSYSIGYTNHRKGEPLAPARCVSRELLEKLGHLWSNNLDKNPDINAWSNKLSKVKNQVILSCKEKDGLIVDIKSNTNINSFKKVMSVKDNKRTVPTKEKLRMVKLIKKIF
jgi:hypothetical protein